MKKFNFVFLGEKTDETLGIFRCYQAPSGKIYLLGEEDPEQGTLSIRVQENASSPSKNFYGNIFPEELEESLKKGALK